MLLSNRRHQLNGKQALQSIAQYPQGSFNIPSQITPCLENLPLLTALSKYASALQNMWRKATRELHQNPESLDPKQNGVITDVCKAAHNIV